jgi:hypothetical protein
MKSGNDWMDMTLMKSKSEWDDHWLILKEQTFWSEEVLRVIEDYKKKWSEKSQ